MSMVWSANDDLDGLSSTFAALRARANGGGDEASEGPSPAGQSLHDEIDDFVSKLDSTEPDLPTEWNGAARTLLQRFLDLRRPRLDPKMMECFKMDAFLDVFISFVTEGYSEDDEVAVRRARSVADVISNTDDWSLQLLETRGPRLVQSLMRIFLPDAKGSFADFRRICERMLASNPSPLLKALLEPPSPAFTSFLDEKDLKKSFVFYICKTLPDSAASDVVVSSLLLPVVKQQRIERLSRLENLRKEQFVEYLFNCFAETDDDEYLSNLTDMIIRLIEETSRTDDAWVMFRAMESDSASVEQLLNLLATKTTRGIKQRAAVDILYALVFKSIYRPPRPVVQAAALVDTTPNLSLKDVRKKVLEVCGQKASQLCHALQFGDFTLRAEWSASSKTKPLTVSRVQLLEVLFEAASEVPDCRQELLAAMPWKAIVNWFFEHKSSSSLQTLVYKFLDMLIKNRQTTTLKTVLSKNKLLARLIDSVGDPDQRGIVITICNAIRSAAQEEGSNGYLPQLLGSTEKWQGCIEVVEKETTRQNTPIMPLELSKPEPPKLGGRFELLSRMAKV